MRTIPEATPISLSAEEREALEALSGSRKSEARMRERARIVLLAAAGASSRAIARAVRCTPGTASTHTSWLNQIEIWFSILTRNSLSGASFRSAAELVDHIDSFIASYNADARPFVWTNSAVHQKQLKPCFAV